MSIDLSAMRHQYSNQPLEVDQKNKDPFEVFERWFSEAVNAKLTEPNAMTLATVNQHGHADARVVLLKSLDDQGFVFYSNYSSAKGNQIDFNPNACLVFLWLELERQIRIRGSIKKYDSKNSEIYFQSRPRESQIAAWASPQSHVIARREDLEFLVEENRSLFAGNEVLPKPVHWGGYHLIPSEIEFWQGRKNRLHDRLLYSRENDGWKIVRLAP